MINLMYEHYGRVAGRIDAYCMFLEGECIQIQTMVFPGLD